eukprot:TRINITY_DN11207_c0_g1_i1.p1 TRINITY_DN11207_c0_g1~~TRINITY_DN11207_c0_g1_i1.p1  ORF type:complete len:478 (-),score=131.17 TRINITY_DN11207_c0_g1_i1:70-1503(-)
MSTSDNTDAPALKLWGGRFTGATDPLMERFNASIGYDKTMWQADIRGSQTYARGLAKCGIISVDESEQLIAGLDRVATEWADGSFKIVSSDEDIHTANERRLTELIGPEVAGKLHTGRSRNDQVATDVRLWLSGQVQTVKGYMRQLIASAVKRADEHMDLIMPGYTHLQPAQPIRFSHWVLSHAWAWHRDYQRLDDLNRRVRQLPLGSGALAGNPFGVDRHFLAEDLGFGAANVTMNSLDSVSDRDFIIEFLFFASLCGIHLSRWAEDLIIYSSKEFGYVSIADAYSTGSSLMPQKRNPDALELVRGKVGRMCGGLNTLLMSVKGIPTSYNKDLQEDKEPLFDTVDTISAVLQISTGVLSTLTPVGDRMKKGLAGEMLATDLADYLVRKGVPFRETHHIAGEAVKIAEDRGCSLTDLTVDDLKPLHKLFDSDVTDVWSFVSSVEQRKSVGGTSESAVKEQISKLKSWLEEEDKKSSV